jgi:hypothetical protein
MKMAGGAKGKGWGNKKDGRENDRRWEQWLWRKRSGVVLPCCGSRGGGGGGSRMGVLSMQDGRAMNNAFF